MDGDPPGRRRSRSTPHPPVRHHRRDHRRTSGGFSTHLLQLLPVEGGRRARPVLPVIDDAIADGFDFAPGDDLVEKVAFLLLAVFRTAASRREIGYDEYIALMDRHPELARRRFQHIDDVEAVVAELVTARLADGGPTPGNTVHDTADMIVTVAGALMRSALRPLLTAPGKTEADADSVLRRTCLLFREVTRP